MTLAITCLGGVKPWIQALGGPDRGAIGGDTGSGAPGCFYSLGDPFLGVLRIRALRFWCVFWKLPGVSVPCIYGLPHVAGPCVESDASPVAGTAWIFGN